MAEDFDGDGFTDLAVAAPFASNGVGYENGAVYIYKNADKSFDLYARLESNYESKGRFGSTIVKIGDINRDGFNDLAIGAPYEDNGAVYIYLGGSNGLSIKPSQKIVSPNNELMNEPFTPQMFGHQLSKGADIDGNNYLGNFLLYVLQLP